MMRPKFAIQVTALTAALLLGPLFLFFAGFLTVDSIVSIDSLSTKRAPGMTDARFDQVKIGMRAKEVEELLGKPLRNLWKSSNVVEWSFSLPKEPIDGVGTWNQRDLLLSNGVVCQIERRRLMNH